MTDTPVPPVVKTATLIWQVPEWIGRAALYHLSYPATWAKWDYDSDKMVPRLTSYVIVSAAVTPDGPETFIFPANPKGHLLDKGEMKGSFRGGLDHARALANLGYTIVDQ